VTTGTGSGKSLTYLVPIYDHILRNHPERHQVRAIIVYPMNALINSQFKALLEFAAQAGNSVVRLINTRDKRETKNGSASRTTLRTCF